MRVGQVPSAAKDPESRTRRTDCQNASINESRFPPLTPPMRKIVRMAADTMMMASVRRPNHEMTTHGPRDSAASNRYRALAPNESLAPARSRTAG
jgi:hypothetical protein